MQVCRRTHPRHRTGSWLPLLAAFLLAGCPGRDPAATGPIDREEFITIVVELRRAQAEATSRDEFEERKAGVLAEHGVSEDDVRAFVQRHGGDVRLMSEVWDSVQTRLQRPPEIPPAPDAELTP
jgi:hypothetical protein